jgi:single-stranded-DNA-specific exonuclease
MKFENSLELAKEFHLSEKIINILGQRGLDTKESLKAYLYPDIKDLHDPFLLKDMSILV